TADGRISQLQLFNAQLTGEAADGANSEINQFHQVNAKLTGEATDGTTSEFHPFRQFNAQLTGEAADGTTSQFHQFNAQPISEAADGTTSEFHQFRQFNAQPTGEAADGTTSQFHQFDPQSSTTPSARSSPDPMAEQQAQEARHQFELAPIDVACLDFCIELLNQRIQVEDYECALVCALAVLGRGEGGWRDAESYPPILSKIIRISRFMVVHKAMRLDRTAGEMMQLLQNQRMTGYGDVDDTMDD